MSGLMLNKEATKEQYKFGKKYIDIIIDVLKQFPVITKENTKEIKQQILPHLNDDMQVNVFHWGDISILFEDGDYPIVAVSVRVDENNTQIIDYAYIELEYEYVSDEDMPYDTISYHHRVI